MGRKQEDCEKLRPLWGRGEALSLNAQQVKALEQLFGHNFGDCDILRQAFVHSSYLHENPSFPLMSNERLEFLGDAFLNYVAAAYLYQRFPEEPEGTLTKLRAGAVQRDTLARVARSLDLGQYLLLGRGEERTGGRERASILANVYEAAVGALLVDGGEVTARAFVLRTLSDPLREVVAGTLGADFKSQLQEFCQARKWDAPVYQVVAEEGQPHAKRFQVQVLVHEEALGRGSGSNRQRAEKEAACQALTVLQERESAS